MTKQLDLIKKLLSIRNITFAVVNMKLLITNKQINHCLYFVTRKFSISNLSLEPLYMKMA